ncbi:UNVERIFIED_CONTAM: hypothetical protein Slati_2389200 [Sesamum latifolium]|uniref:Reverse transcriptase n=1 Tax=Sesamum latifolium TaxID=2727402 RepID=A0AAW2WB66_9LAMI
MIQKFLGEHNKFVEDTEDLQHLISRHFAEIFGSCYPSAEDVERRTEYVLAKVDERMNYELLQPYTAEQVQKAIFQMAPLKSLGQWRAPSISHLLFADDKQIYCQTNHQSINSIKRILDTYAKASGQVIDYEKSHMVLNKNTDQASRETLSQILGLRPEEHNEKYLGLPSMIGRSKRGVFLKIRDRVWKQVEGWNERNLSQAGQSIMIKLVIQAISTFAMSVFGILDSLLNEIQRMTFFFFGITKRKRRSTGSVGLDYARGNLKEAWDFDV